MSETETDIAVRCARCYQSLEREQVTDSDPIVHRYRDDCVAALQKAATDIKAELTAEPSEPLSPEECLEARELANKATPPPWISLSCRLYTADERGRQKGDLMNVTGNACYFLREEDAFFARSARELVPRLLSTVEALRVFVPPEVDKLSVCRHPNGWAPLTVFAFDGHRDFHAVVCPTCWMFSPSFPKPGAPGFDDAQARTRAKRFNAEKVAEVVSLVQKVAAAAESGDGEKVSAFELRAHRAALQAIAERKAEDPVGVAQAALKTLEIAGPRY